MLVLTRRIGEEIIIGDNIRVKIVSIKGDRIRVGIEAPPSVTVDRAEIYARRIEFAPATGLSAQANGQVIEPRHMESFVALGEMPVSQASADETLCH